MRVHDSVQKIWHIVSGIFLFHIKNLITQSDDDQKFLLESLQGSPCFCKILGAWSSPAVGARFSGRENSNLFKSLVDKKEKMFDKCAGL